MVFVQADRFSPAEGGFAVSERKSGADTPSSHGSKAVSDEVLPVQSLSLIDEKALVRRIDYRLLPILFIVYMAAFLDRSVLERRSFLMYCLC